MDIVIVLSLLVIIIILFAQERLSVDVVTVLMLIVLTTTGILTTSEAFEGFSSDFIVILACIFILTGAIQETGIVDYFIQKAMLHKIKSYNPLLILIMFVSGFVSAFMNNTTTTAFFLNPVISIAKKSGISASKLLMPLAFASIIGGTCTLIGTSTNVAVSGYLDKMNMAPLSMFEILPVGIIFFLALIVYMLFVGKRFLPDNKEEELSRSYEMRKYLSEIIVMQGSSLAGQELFNSRLVQLGFRIFGVIKKNTMLLPTSNMLIEDGDLILVEGKIDDLMKVKDTEGIEIRADSFNFFDIQDSNIKLSEVLIPSKSELIGSSVKEINFRQKYGLLVMAIHRPGYSPTEKLGDIKLSIGDLLLIQGPQERFAYLRDDRNFLILDEHEPKNYSKKKGILTILFFMAAIVLGTFKLLPLSICFLSAAVLSVLIKAINIKKAYDNIDWRLLILIAGMSALGTAMMKTGSDRFLSDIIIGLLNPYGIYAVMAGFVMLTVFLTQPMSNAAAALVVLPIAIKTANGIGADPRSFAIMVMISASISLITPFEPSCILVYGPGKYKFSDFLKIGTGITLILIVVLVLLMPLIWPLYK